MHSQLFAGVVLIGVGVFLLVWIHEVAARPRFDANLDPNGYVALAHASIEAARASIFNGYTLADSTKSIDVETASLAEIEVAYQDCVGCIHTEYPETDEGCGVAFKLCDTMDAALAKRFPHVSWNNQTYRFDYKDEC